MATNLRAGAARVEITPPVGQDLTGFLARENPSIGVRDPLYARALVLDDEDRQIAIVSCDLLGFGSEYVDEIRDRVAMQTGISAPHVMLACTHTHGGPATIQLVGTGTINPDYVESLMPLISDVVAQAQSNLQPATLALGDATSTEGVHNRRTPGDVIDPQVGLLRVDDVDGKTLAVIVNYTCHPTSLNHVNRHITADYPGLVTQRIEDATGGIALFLMGAIGDVGPVTRGEESLATVGNAVADAALAALPTLTDNPIERLSVGGEMLALPLFPLPTRDQWIEWRTNYEAAALEAERAGSTGALMPGSSIPVSAKLQWAMVKWTEIMFEMMQDDTLSPTVAAEVQVLHIGDLAIVGVPGEYFVELGLQIKKGIQKSGVRQVMISGFTNGDVGYIPARRAYPKGGYEVAEAYKFYGYPAAIAPEGGEMIVSSAVKLGSSPR